MNIFTYSKAIVAGTVLLTSLGASAQVAPPVAADRLNYQREITDAQLDDACEAVEIECNQALTAIYGLRGGKEGNLPEEHAYQYQFTLGPDNYVGYACVPHSDFIYGDFNLASTYGMETKCIGGPGGGFSAMRAGVCPLINDAALDNIPELKAIYLLLYNYGAIENADLFGPEPYVDFKQDRTSSPFTYNDLRTIYYTAEANIDSIVNCLKYFDNRNRHYKEAVDGILQSSLGFIRDYDATKRGMDPWIRFANSLKLRMAIHISAVEPETAKKWAEEAVAGGVMEKADDQVGIWLSDYGKAHPLVQISEWGDTRLGASFASILKSLNHPYAEYLYQPNADPIAKVGTLGSAPDYTPADYGLIGMRDGTVPGVSQSAGSNTYISFSKLDNEYASMMCFPAYLMKYSEVCFNRAEGAVRGWNMGGTAQQFYEEGIKYAYCEDPIYEDEIKYLDKVDDYMAQDKATDFTYVDPTGNTPDMPSVTKIGVKWDDNLDRETKLEMIITQKYIAQFPYSFEPWVDLRRTGYPKIFPVLNVADGDGSLKEGEQMRRIPWASDDPQTQKDIETTGLKALNGSDQMATRLWWDTGKNFPDATGISNIAAGKGLAVVVAGEGTISVSGADKAEVFDMTGRLVKRLDKAGTVGIAKGLYVVKTQSGSHQDAQKVLVK